MRSLKTFGCLVALTLAIKTPVLTQSATAPQTTTAQGRRGAGAAQQTPASQSPTFARIQARTCEFREGPSPVQLPYEVFVPS